MRIATLSNAAVMHTRRWVEHFRARGHEVRLYSLERSAEAPAGLGEVRLPRAPLPGVFRYPLAVPRLVHELRAFAPDVVDAHYVPNYGFMGALSGVRPLSIAAWGSDLLLAAGRSPLQQARARFALRRAALVLCDAENLAAAARAAGAPAERVRALPWGVDRTRFRAAAERERGLILSTRMHEEIYDMPLIIDAAARVLAARPEATLAIAGGGSLTPLLERLAETRLPRGRYHFLGLLEPAVLAAWLDRAEVFVSAARSDSTSQSLLEAMAAGAVPVVSDIAGNREWVGEGDGARLFTPGDVHALERAFERVLAEPDWCAQARERNAAVVAARGDWQVNLARIEHWFEELARGGALPGGGAA